MSIDPSLTEEKKESQDDVDAGHVELKVTDASGDEMLFKVKRSAKMRRLFTAYCKRLSIDPATIRFFYRGERINEDDTPDDLVLKDGDNIDAFVRQVGGF